MDSDLFAFVTSEAGLITFFPLMYWLCVDRKILNTITGGKRHPDNLGEEHEVILAQLCHEVLLPHLNFTLVCSTGSVRSDASLGLRLRRTSRVRERSCKNRQCLQ